MKRTFSFLLKQFASIAIIMLVLMLGTWLIELKNNGTVRKVAKQAEQIQQSVDLLANNLNDWQFRLEEYQQEQQDINKQIAMLESEYPLVDAFYKWWYDDELERLNTEKQKLENKITHAQERITQLGGQITNYYKQKSALEQQAAQGSITDKLKKYFWMAVLVLLSGWLALLLIKLMMYYVIAPWVATFKPVCVDSQSNGDVNFDGVADLKAERRSSVPISGVSLELSFTNNQELVTHQNYLQSSSVDDDKQTILLLSPQYFFTSIAAGLTLMMRYRTQRSQSTVTLSPPSGIVNEIGVIDLPANTRFVCKARAIVGIVRKRGAQVPIRRKWKFGLHNWVTFQFRYLIFEGECSLIVKGSRGIKVEKGGAGRMINRSRILGFSANMKYSNTRCETFVGYLTGTDDLFNDLFHRPENNQEGYFMYEEIPSRDGKNIFTRGLEGFFDAVLKVFGI